MFKRCLDKIFEKEYQNFKHRPSEKDTNADSLSNKEDDRVHGLSGNDLNMSEDDLLLEEGQESQTIIGMVKCTHSDLHKKDNLDMLAPKLCPPTEMSKEDTIIPRNSEN
jgi:hypothetical protein